jgi:ATP/ADP translocase
MTSEESNKFATGNHTLLFALSCGVVMIHFVFSRAFRDSLLQNGLSIRSLPSLIIIGTLCSLVLSFVLSWLFKRFDRATVLPLAYIVMGVGEFFLSLGLLPQNLACQAFYVLISVSTATGLSLVWLRASDWFSNQPELKEKAVPTLLASGTAGGLLAGFGLVHLHFATNFSNANIILALLNFTTAALLFTYRPEPEKQDRVESSTSTTRREKMNYVVIMMLAGTTILGATASTLLDLTYRVSAAERYHSQQELLHFFGFMQALLGVAAVFAQLGLWKWQPSGDRRYMMAMYALGGCAAAVLTAIVPSFALLTAMRTGEYAMRNSLFRFGTEMTYAELPNHLRQQTRPVVDIVGERIGDSLAAGLLQLLLFINSSLPLRLVLVCLAGVALLLWMVCERMTRIPLRRRQLKRKEEEDSMLLYASAEEGKNA